MIKMMNITKVFPGVKALDDVTLEAHSGRILALIGINGAGKSTLMNILGGIIRQDKGEILVKGELTKFKSPKDSQRCGISFIHQEPVSFLSMTVAENIYISDLCKSKVPGVVDKGMALRCSKKHLELLGANINPKAKMEDISIGERQIVEIARTLAMGAHTVIFDEPTSSLSLNEKKRLFEVIKQMRADGRTIIYISHFLDEIHELCDDYLVLRDGIGVGSGKVCDVTKNDLVRMIIGKDLGKLEKRKGSIEDKETILSVRNIQSGNLLKGVSFDLKKGEILGIWGLMGSGRTELMRAIFGLDRVDGGEVLIRENGTLKKINRNKLLKRCGYLTENRHDDGLFYSMPVWKNCTAPCLIKYSHNLLGFTNTKQEIKIADRLIEKLSIKAPNAKSIVSQLSGGNQQKVIMAKWLDKRADILVLDEPTRGVDVGSKLEIQKIVRDLAQNGISIILITSEIEEMVDLSDRVLILREGKIQEQAIEDEITENNLIRLALSGGGI
ncbi:MAG: sugar ABC transporter ATP-binding protein [Christensenellales bacterium]|jgi:ABC-type sugar transport system ATPase subunit